MVAISRSIQMDCVDIDTRPLLTVSQAEEVMHHVLLLFHRHSLATSSLWSPFLVIPLNVVIIPSRNNRNI